MPPSTVQVAMHQKLIHNFEFFCRSCVKIEIKNPGSIEKPAVIPFVWNDAQRYLWAVICKMMLEVGMVRLMIVKGRQQGISTFIEIFLFWLALFVASTKVCIISHEAASTAALFQKVKFAHKELPAPIRPELQASNRNELVLPNDSRYLILTAGSEESGRSQTAHHQHQSERGFFENAEAIDAGAGQIVADVPGTYIFKESTGNGQNHFYLEVMEALAGKGVYRVCFIPWFWEKGYRTKPRIGFVRDDEEQELIDLYGRMGLRDDWQLQWRRDKIVELKGLKKFKQEYPNTLMEAFQVSGNSFYDSNLVQKAVLSDYRSDYGPIILGCDAGRDGDRTIIAIRRGAELIKIIKYDNMNSTRLAGILANLINEWKADKCFIDWGMGHGTIDTLNDAHYGHIVTGVNFGGESSNPVYKNKRAEMAHAFKDWLGDGNPSIPNDDDMIADIASMPEPEPTANGSLKFPEKKQIKKAYGRSPDILDAIMLTFAFPVLPSQIEIERWNDRFNGPRKSELHTLRRKRSDTREEKDNGIVNTDGSYRVTGRSGGDADWWQGRRRR